MKLLKFAGIFLLASCGQQATSSTENAATVIAPSPSPTIEESEASKQSRAQKAAQAYMPASYDQYPAYLRYWARQVDSNDVLCFGGNGDLETTRKNCDMRDAMVLMIKPAGWCRKGEAGKQVPTWYVCGPLKPKLLDLSDHKAEESAPSDDPNNSPALDENGKPTTWNAASHAWEEN